MTDVFKRKLRFVLTFSAFFAALWFFWDTALVYPLKIFVVLLHELSHAMAVWATGGTVERITLDPAQGGATYFVGGSTLLALNAGYLGSLAWGGLMFSASRAERVRADWINAGIAVMVALLTVFFIRGPFGIAFGLVFGSGLWVVSRRVGRDVNRHILSGLGLTSALYAVLDIKSDVLDRPELQSDAFMLAEATGIGSATFWGVLWIGVALAFCAWLLRRSLRAA
jgi:hypothetical protein